MKQNKKPLVSVVMPVHNAEKYLAEAIDSILNQTYKNLELIMVNDASTDGSAKILASYKKLFPKKIKVMHTTHALGKSGDPATNMAIRKARGEFIAKMDADDIAHVQRIAKQVEYLQTHQDIYLVGTQAYVINKKGERIGKKQVPLSHRTIYKNFFLYNYLTHPSVMFRNEKKGKDFYEIKFPHFNEYYTFMKLMYQGKKFANMPDYLLNYRIHGENDTLTNTKKKFMSTLKMRFVFMSEFGYKPTVSQLATTFLQAIVVFLLPSGAIPFLYLVSRKAISIEYMKEQVDKHIYSYRLVLQRHLPSMLR